MVLTCTVPKTSDSKVGKEGEMATQIDVCKITFEGVLLYSTIN